MNNYIVIAEKSRAAAISRRYRQINAKARRATNFLATCYSLLLSFGRRDVFAPDVAGGLVLAHT
jgi:hypothetical protein